jgi:1-acyl-sn-glycerol-3-phosphate acyltransferase
MKGVSVSALVRLALLVVYVIIQIPCVLVPLFLGRLLFPESHRYNKYVRSLLSPLSTGVYLLFFSIRLAVQIDTRMIPRVQRNKFRFLLMTHSSTLDFMVVTTASWIIHQAMGGVVCIVKKELLSMPFIGWLQVAAGSVPVARSGDVHAAKKNLAIAEQRVKEGYVLAGFPEGSRRRTPSCGREQLLPFKKGMFHIAHGVGNVEFIPLVMVGGNSGWPSNYLLPIPGSKVVVRIGEPIKPVENETVDEMTARVRTCMQDEIEKTGAMGPKGTDSYSTDAAFAASVEISLWELYGLEAVLMAVPMLGALATLLC